MKDNTDETHQNDKNESSELILSETPTTILNPCISTSFEIENLPPGSPPTVIVIKTEYESCDSDAELHEEADADADADDDAVKDEDDNEVSQNLSAFQSTAYLLPHNSTKENLAVNFIENPGDADAKLNTLVSSHEVDDGTDTVQEPVNQDFDFDVGVKQEVETEPESEPESEPETEPKTEPEPGPEPDPRMLTYLEPETRLITFDDSLTQFQDNSSRSPSVSTFNTCEKSYNNSSLLLNRLISNRAITVNNVFIKTTPTTTTTTTATKTSTNPHITIEVGNESECPDHSLLLHGLGTGTGTGTDEEKEAASNKFQCPFCSKRFVSNSKVLRHTETHKSQRERVKPFKCSVPECDYSSYRSDALVQHLKMHSQDKPFKCSHPNCDKSFKFKHHILLHMNSHSDSRQFKCPDPKCDKTFKYKTHMNKHYRSHTVRS